MDSKIIETFNLKNDKIKNIDHSKQKLSKLEVPPQNENNVLVLDEIKDNTEKSTIDKVFEEIEKNESFTNTNGNLIDIDNDQSKATILDGKKNPNDFEILCLKTSEQNSNFNHHDNIMTNDLERSKTREDAMTDDNNAVKKDLSNTNNRDSSQYSNGSSKVLCGIKENIFNDIIKKDYNACDSTFQNTEENVYDANNIIDYKEQINISEDAKFNSYDSFEKEYYINKLDTDTNESFVRNESAMSSIALNEELMNKYKELEQQQEVLNKSLISLTTHFAQVQLRLKQIINSPKNEQEILLKHLEKFTFIGIPEVNELCLYNYDNNGASNRNEQHCDEQHFQNDKNYIEDKLKFEKNKHKEMINKLRTQLEQLENYVYEYSNNDSSDLPTNLIINKQQIIINELKEKLNLNININEEEDDQVKCKINNSIIQPMKSKEELIVQLKTQINDLEKFINFLQNTQQCKCSTSKMTTVDGAAATNENDIRNKTINIMKKISTILHIFAEHHSENFKKNTLKKTIKINHYGDLRAQLEIAINNVMDVCKQPSESDMDIPDSDYMSDNDDSIVSQCNSKVAIAVRKHLVPCLQRLLQHGLSNNDQTISVISYISCSSTQSNKNISNKQMHIWELIHKYYILKNGEEFNTKPIRKLSESFNLNIGGGSCTGVNNLGVKQNLLASIGNIINIHNKYKKYNYDSYFKSFVCDGLNKKLLIQWLHLILNYKYFIDTYYTPWSYVNTTKFTDTAQSLQNLYEFHFNLPIVDMTIRHLQNIKDAF